MLCCLNKQKEEKEPTFMELMKAPFYNVPIERRKKKKRLFQIRLRQFFFLSRFGFDI